MSLFSKPENNDKWKDKYLNLLDEQEHAAKRTQEKEQLLCKTIIRISIAASGLDPQLDPSLQRIRDHLKNGINSEKLKAELGNFIDVLAQLNDDASAAKKTLDKQLLFDFLLQHYQQPRQQQALRQLQQKSFDTAGPLFLAIAEIIAEEKPGAEAGDTDNPDTADISKQLLRLLESIEIPAEFAQQSQTLKRQLSDAHAVTTDLLNNYIDLLIKIDRRPLPEQEEIDRFLAYISEQLTDLSQTVTGAAAATIEVSLSRNRFDQSVSEQMQELQSTTINATKLEPLKEVIRNRLLSITKEIQEHAQQEAAQRQNTQQQLDELNNKLKDMEHESVELKSKLDAAKNQALRDTLTNLPNRIAYKERFDAEIARWKRYQTPLAIVVWDIDHFKNINDTYGHKAGDKALMIIAKQLFENCRETDFISRFGGEEFVMLLTNTSKESALILANQLRKRIEHTGFNSGGTAISITISCGITEFTAGDTDESAFERADQALYKAKQQGRNQCCLG
ncbi:MAG: diguanylate cyclase [Methylococcales bacterium]